MLMLLMLWIKPTELGAGPIDHADCACATRAAFSSPRRRVKKSKEKQGCPERMQQSQQAGSHRTQFEDRMLTWACCLRHAGQPFRALACWRRIFTPELSSCSTQPEQVSLNTEQEKAHPRRTSCHGPSLPRVGCARNVSGNTEARVICVSRCILCWPALIAKSRRRGGGRIRRIEGGRRSLRW